MRRRPPRTLSACLSVVCTAYRIGAEPVDPRYNQLDLNFKKNFRAGSKTFSGQVDFFNALNGNAIFGRQDAVGNSLGDVTTILQGRLIRLAFQMRF